MQKGSALVLRVCIFTRVPTACVRTLRLAQRRWKVCGSAPASSEAAAGGRRRAGGGGGRTGRGSTPASFGVCVARSNPLPRRQPGGCRSRPRRVTFALTDLLL